MPYSMNHLQGMKILSRNDRLSSRTRCMDATNIDRTWQAVRQVRQQGSREGEGRRALRESTAMLSALFYAAVF
jgi:hypothetical protein